MEKTLVVVVSVENVKKFGHEKALIHAICRCSSGHGYHTAVLFKHEGVMLRLNNTDYWRPCNTFTYDFCLGQVKQSYKDEDSFMLFFTQVK